LFSNSKEPKFYGLTGKCYYEEIIAIPSARLIHPKTWFTDV